MCNIGKIYNISILYNYIIVQPPSTINLHKEVSSKAIRLKKEAAAQSMQVARSRRAI